MPRPIWVVRLQQHQTHKTDTKYVRAATQDGAIRCAKANSMLPMNAQVIEVRHATPQDLECVQCM
jgi:hypothetical protein